MATDNLGQAMGRLRRSLEQAGERVREAAEQAAREGGRTTTHVSTGEGHNVAIAANVGRSPSGRGRVRGVSSVQRVRRRPDGTSEVETRRTVFGDDASGE